MDNIIPKKGPLKKSLLPYLLNNLWKEKLTGILKLTDTSTEKNLFIKDGYIIFANSNIDDDRLGELLLRLGKIDKNQYDISVRLMKETGKRQGQILVEEKAITAKDLFWIIKYQIKEIITSLFLWDKGEYEFIHGELPMDEIITLDISTGNIIIEGIKNINDLSRIKNGLPPIETIPCRSLNPLNLFQDVKFDTDIEKILSVINGKNRIRDICNISGQMEIDALKNLYILYSTGFIINKKEGEDTENIEIDKKQEEKIEDEEFKKEIEKIHTAYTQLKDQNNYEIMGLKENAKEAEIRKAYFRLAKLYHPDRHLQQEMAGLKKELEELFSRITEAYNILIDEEKKREYDMSLASRFVKHKEAEESKEEKEYKAKAQFIIGKKNMDKGNYWGAADAFRWAVKLDPNNANYFSFLGKALSHVPRRLHEAEENCKKAIKLDPSNAAHYINLAMLYKRAGLDEKARINFEEALRWEPENDTALTELGRKKGANITGLFKGLFSSKK